MIDSDATTKNQPPDMDLITRIIQAATLAVHKADSNFLVWAFLLEAIARNALGGESVLQP